MNVLRNIQIEIEKINNDLPKINYGGCGTFSYHLNKVLKDKYDINSEIYYLKGDPAAIDYDILFSHIVLKVDNYIIDNNGFYDYYDYSRRVDDIKPLSIDKLEEMLYIPGLWNSEFYNNENINELINRIYKI